MWLTLSGAAAGQFIIMLVDLLRWIPRRYLHGISYAILIATIGVLLALYWRDAIHSSHPYSRNSIATFNSGRGGPPLTDLGQPFSIMTDNSLNNRSKTSYERAEEIAHGEMNGFLRLYYQLEPREGTDGWVGVFADFTLPPAKPVDMSAFAGISLRLRVSQGDGKRPDVRVVLYSDNIQDPLFAYPVVAISGDSLSAGWRREILPFENFGAPSFVSHQVDLNPRRIFRIGLLVVGDERVHGQIDVDDIRLFRANAGT